ncbi:LAETG motif-containing sortase-dependent surface protein [Streptomyces sp. C10-9-1]|uniref:LAETG motif-containing sortase-dependent surface protein n=1 Tax=Streptomyces sp. C10-9-1 TaxID=1859285 RepID=UPI003D75E818
MSVARRPLLTAATAGTLLCALWFVPSANATADKPARSSAATSSTPAPSAEDGGQGLRLAETGSVDTTPYLAGGAACLAIGAGFVAFSVRRGAARPS